MIIENPEKNDEHFPELVFPQAKVRYFTFFATFLLQSKSRCWLFEIILPKWSGFLIMIWSYR